jgi:hypothetical protein
MMEELLVGQLQQQQQQPPTPKHCWHGQSLHGCLWGGAEPSSCSHASACC